MSGSYMAVEDSIYQCAYMLQILTHLVKESTIPVTCKIRILPEVHSLHIAATIVTTHPSYRIHWTWSS